jgi:hypothetical protein
MEQDLLGRPGASGLRTDLDLLGEPSPRTSCSPSFPERPDGPRRSSSLGCDSGPGGEGAPRPPGPLPAATGLASHSGLGSRFRGTLPWSARSYGHRGHTETSRNQLGASGLPPGVCPAVSVAPTWPGRERPLPKRAVERNASPAASEFSHFRLSRGPRSGPLRQYDSRQGEHMFASRNRDRRELCRAT